MSPLLYVCPYVEMTMFAFSLWRPNNNNNGGEASRSKNCTIKYRNAFKEPMRQSGGRSTTIFIGLFYDPFWYVLKGNFTFIGLTTKCPPTTLFFGVTTRENTYEGIAQSGVGGLECDGSFGTRNMPFCWSVICSFAYEIIHLICCPFFSFLEAARNAFLLTTFIIFLTVMTAFIFSV